MNYKYSEIDKENLIKRYLSGESAATIVEENGVPRSTFYSWVKKYSEKQNVKNKKVVSPSDFRLLLRNNERLNGIIKILQTATCTATAPLSEKLNALELLYGGGQYSVRVLCEALMVDRGTFYNHIFRNLKGNNSYAKRREELRIKIQEIYDDSKQIFGAKKIAAVLKSRGERISHTMVSELMRDMGLVSIRQDSKSLFLKQKKKKKYANTLSQNFTTNAPNQVWVSDITHFKYGEKWYYICVIIDLFSRKAIGCRTSLKNSTYLTKATFKQAYASRQPQNKLLFHSDRESVYGSAAFRNCLISLGVEQSFSRVRVPYDNSVSESFFASMKREELYRTNYRSENEFKKAIDDYIVFYNEKRPHKSCQYKTPEQAETSFFDKQAV